MGHNNPLYRTSSNNPRRKVIDLLESGQVPKQLPGILLADGHAHAELERLQIRHVPQAPQALRCQVAVVLQM